MPGATSLPSASAPSTSVLSYRPHAAAALCVAAALAFALSLQYLVQPFVWLNWPVGDVLIGWLYVFRDRAIVAVTIAACIVSSQLVRTESARWRAVRLAAAILIGAVAGELVIRALYDTPTDLGTLSAQALRWIVVALAVAFTFYLWRKSADSGEQLRRDSLRRASLEQQLVNTRLAALRSQIEPHFLFNTLATVRRLQHTEPSAGVRMLAAFVEYLRCMTSMVERGEVMLSEEMDLVRAYLDVIYIRMGGTLAVTIDVAASLHAARVPALAVATLVENAVKHGVTPATHGCEISVRAVRMDRDVVLSVTDTGVGLKLDGGGGSGIGLSNVRARLITMYGSRASLRVEGHAPRGVCATLRLPCRYGSAS